MLAQSHWDKKHLQKDGWGIASWQMAEGRFKIVKSEKSVFKEKEKFKRAAQSTKSKIILAHIRHASNPKKIPRKKLISLKNCQPFVYRNLAFAHNGTLNIPDAVAETLGEYKERICGTNDSEVLFWLFVKIYFSVIASPPPRIDGRIQLYFWQKVFSRMVQEIKRIWNSIPKRKRKFSSPFRGLNCIASDGETLAAQCWYEKAEGKSLCGQNRPYFEMCYNILLDRVAVASEPMEDSKNWKALPNKHLLIVNNQLKPICLPFVGEGGVG